jgi:hypothetical protein
MSINLHTGQRSIKRAIDYLIEDSTKESADYIKQFIKTSVIIPDEHPSILWHMALNSMSMRGMITEFGVWKGESINFMSSLAPDCIFYGFDSFHGLKEDWHGGYYPKNFFSLNGSLPAVNSNVKLIAGWFQDTLPLFLKEHKDSVRLINIDCDTYESTKYVLETLHERIVEGTVIIFDEYLGYPGWKDGEFKAWKEYCEKYSIAYEYLAFGGQGEALVKIKNYNWSI